MGSSWNDGYRFFQRSDQFEPLDADLIDYQLVLAVFCFDHAECKQTRKDSALGRIQFI